MLRDGITDSLDAAGKPKAAGKFLAPGSSLE
jgi:hypothetical protein